MNVLGFFQSSYLCSPCVTVSFSPLYLLCSGPQEAGTRSRRWCAEAVKTERREGGGAGEREGGMEGRRERITLNKTEERIEKTEYGVAVLF